MHLLYITYVYIYIYEGSIQGDQCSLWGRTALGLKKIMPPPLCCWNRGSYQPTEIHIGTIFLSWQPERFRNLEDWSPKCASSTLVPSFKHDRSITSYSDQYTSWTSQTHSKRTTKIWPGKQIQCTVTDSSDGGWTYIQLWNPHIWGWDFDIGSQ